MRALTIRQPWAWPVLGKPGEPTECATGAIVGAVTLVGTHPSADCGGTCSPWAETTARWHLELADPGVFSRPIPTPGRLGVWEVKDTVVDHLVRDEMAG